MPPLTIPTKVFDQLNIKATAVTITVGDPVVVELLIESGPSSMHTTVQGDFIEAIQAATPEEAAVLLRNQAGFPEPS